MLPGCRSHEHLGCRESTPSRAAAAFSWQLGSMPLPWTRLGVPGRASPAAQTQPQRSAAQPQPGAPRVSMLLSYHCYRHSWGGPNGRAPPAAQPQPQSGRSRSRSRSQRFLQESWLQPHCACGKGSAAAGSAPGCTFSTGTPFQTAAQRSPAQPAPCDAAELQPALSPGVPALRLQRSRAAASAFSRSTSSQTAAQRSEPVASDFSRSVSSEANNELRTAAQRSKPTAMGFQQAVPVSRVKCTLVSLG
jgi:hypothetical protein